MKKLDLASFGVVEMNEAELLTVVGGNIFQAVGKAVVAVAEKVAEVAVDVAEYIADNFKSNTDGSAGGSITLP